MAEINYAELNALSPIVISKQATINIGSYFIYIFILFLFSIQILMKNSKSNTFGFEKKFFVHKLIHF